MGAVTLIAVAAAILDLKNETDKLDRKEADALVVNLKKDQISEIEFVTLTPSNLKQSDKEILTNQFTLEKKSEGWFLKAPIQELADQEAVQRFLDSVTDEKASEVLGLGVAPDWSKFGLQKPKGTVTLKDNSGKTTKIDVSNRKNFEDGSYLRRNEETKVLVGSSAWHTQIDRKIFEFREKRLLRLTANQIEKLNLNTKEEQIDLSYKEGQWTLDQKPSWKLDQTRVQELINSLTGSVITDYLKEGQVLPDDRKKFNVDRPLTTVKLLLKDNKNWSARFGSLKNQAYPVESLEPPMIVNVAAFDGEKIVEAKASDLRDKTTPFEFNKADVQKIELKLSDQMIELEKSDKDWKVSRSKGAEFDPNKTSGLIDKIRALKVSEFLESNAGLNGPIKKTLLLKDSSGKLLMELGLGSSQKKKIKGSDRIFYTAQSSLVSELVVIEESRVKDLGLDEIFNQTQGADAKRDVKKEVEVKKDADQ